MTVHQWLAQWSSWGWPLLANHLWQATLISLIAFTAAGLLRNGPARARYVLWLIASAKFVLPSVLIVQIVNALGIDLSGLIRSSAGTGDGPTVFFQLTAPVGLEDPVGAAQVAQGHNELFCALTVLWLVGSLVLVAMWLGRRWRFRLALRATAPANSAREREALERVRSSLSIKRQVRLSILPGTVEPGVWGVWTPRVFLPQSMAEELTDAELEAVMMHEMIHIARWDNLVANLHRLLCCVFWFHPMVWILDRLLLAERERACDEEVIRLGGAPNVYASSLLKVLRFCLGWNVAGASNATGSNLVRRVERIMSKNVHYKLSARHRVAICSIAALVIILSTAAGLLTREGVIAQHTQPHAGQISGVPEGIAGGVSGIVSGGVIPDQDQLIERLAQASEVAIEFRNSAKAPVLITEAKVRAIPREQDGVGDEFAVIPVVTLTNNGGRRIRGVVFELINPIERRSYYERASSPIEPHAAYTSGNKRGLVIVVGRPERLSVRVSGVVFDDGEVWGAVPPPPPPPQSAAEWKMIESGPETQARVNNREGAPLSITSATFKAARTEPIVRSGSVQDPQERYLIKLSFAVVNNTGRRITGLALEYSNPGSNDGPRVFASANIEPYGTYKLELPPTGSPGSGAYFLSGDPNSREASVIGVRFEDGDIWGSFPPPPPPPPPAAAPGDSKMIRKAGGVFAASATHRVVPETPPLAQAARITGSVVVEVTLDEAGSVIAARAISGHPLLKDAAVNAARQWQFSPTLLSGVAVKVIGTLSFNFEP